jgi:hypothetical protein
VGPGFDDRPVGQVQVLGGGQDPYLLEGGLDPPPPPPSQSSMPEWGTTWLDQRLNKGGNLPDSAGTAARLWPWEKGSKCVALQSGKKG